MSTLSALTAAMVYATAIATRQADFGQARPPRARVNALQNEERPPTPLRVLGVSCRTC